MRNYFTRLGQLSRRDRRVRLQLEALEDRTLLNAYTVNLTTDNGGSTGQSTGPNSGDLRWCINQANLNNNTSSTPDTINFASGLSGTITLKQGELSITDPNLVINGPGSYKLAVSGNNASRVFEISSGTTVTISGMTITRGVSERQDLSDFPGLGGGILNQGNLSLIDDVVYDNRAVVDANVTTEDHTGVGGGGGIANLGKLFVTGSTFVANQALGADGSVGQYITKTGAITFPGMGIAGGLYNASGSTATVTDSRFTGNLAQGGSYCKGTFAGTGQGGAIFNDSNLTVTDTLFSGNRAVGGSHNNDSDFYSGIAVGGAISSGSDEARFPGSGTTAVLMVSDSAFGFNQAVGGDDNSVKLGSRATGPSGGFGGGIFVFQGSAMISESVLDHNQALGGTGVPTVVGGPAPGGMAAGGGILFLNFIGGVDAEVENSLLLHNEAIGGPGRNGGQGGDALGGGLAAGGLSSGPFSKAGKVKVIDTLVALNLAQGGAGGLGGDGGSGWGGGVFNDADSTMTTTKSLITLNRARGGEGRGSGRAGQGVGGGVYNVKPGNFTNDSTRIIFNHASTNDNDCFGC